MESIETTDTAGVRTFLDVLRQEYEVIAHAVAPGAAGAKQRRTLHRLKWALGRLGWLGERPAAALTLEDIARRGHELRAKYSPASTNSIRQTARQLVNLAARKAPDDPALAHLKALWSDKLLRTSDWPRDVLTSGRRKKKDAGEASDLVAFVPF